MAIWFNMDDLNEFRVEPSDDPVERITQTVMSWFEMAVRVERTTVEQPADQPTDPKALAGYAIVLIIIVALFAFVTRMLPVDSGRNADPEDIDIDGLEKWLTWAEEVWREEWPPTLTVWYIREKSTTAESVSKQIIAWFADESQWDYYFPWKYTLGDERRALIREAATAYRHGLYAASTVLFYTQAEGILYDELEISRRLVERLEKRLRKLSPSLARWARPAIEFISVVYESAEPGAARSPWNRHQILHGLKMDVSTPEHAMRAAMWAEMAWLAAFAIKSLEEDKVE